MPNNTSAQAASLPQVRPVWINSTVVLLELRRKFRNLRIFLLAILLPVMFFFMIAYPQRDRLEGSVNSGTYYMIGISAYAAIVSSSAVGAAIPIERVQGWSRALALTPFRPLGYVITKVLSSMLLGAIAVVVMMVLGLVTGMPLDVWQAAQSSLIIIAGSSAFAAFGIFVGYFMSADSAQTLINLIISAFSTVWWVVSSAVLFSSGASGYCALAAVVRVRCFGSFACGGGMGSLGFGEPGGVAGDFCGGCSLVLE